MKVTVRFFGLLKRHLGESERVFELPEGSSAGDLLRLIGEELGPNLPAGLWDGESGRFHRTVRISIKGGPFLDETEPLLDGSELVLLFTMAGG
jgi:molybdopterin converting factor small subunit